MENRLVVASIKDGGSGARNGMEATIKVREHVGEIVLVMEAFCIDWGGS